MLRQASDEVLAITGYRMTSDEKLEPVPESLYHENNPAPPLQIDLADKEGTPLGVIQYIPWPHGGVVRGGGAMPLEGLLPLLLDDPKVLVMSDGEGMQLTNILPLSEDEFREWPRLIWDRSNIRATLKEAEKENLPS